MLVTKDEMKKAATQKGGFTNLQILLAKDYLGSTKGFKKKLIGTHVSEKFWNDFKSAGSKKSKKQKKQSVINSVSKPDDWSWKPGEQDIPEIKRTGKHSKNAGKNKAKREKISKKENVEFYQSRQWLELRVRVLEKYECRCMMCGRRPKEHNIWIHVDHIKPRSRYPELSLRFDNLQILCNECNIGKSNKYITDWRPSEIRDKAIREVEEEKITEALDYEVLANSPL